MQRLRLIWSDRTSSPMDDSHAKADPGGGRLLHVISQRKNTQAPINNQIGARVFEKKKLSLVTAP
jgi:hypothetical protein